MNLQLLTHDILEPELREQSDSSRILLWSMRQAIVHLVFYATSSQISHDKVLRSRRKKEALDAVAQT